MRLPEVSPRPSLHRVDSCRDGLAFIHPMIPDKRPCDVLYVRRQLLLGGGVPIGGVPETLMAERVMLGGYPRRLFGHYVTRTFVAVPT